MKLLFKPGVLLALVVLAIATLAFTHYRPAIEFHMATDLKGVYIADPPAAEATTPAVACQPQDPNINFIVVGDAGTGGPGQRRVAGAMAAFAKETRSEFVVLVGDNFYPHGVDSAEDPQWASKFENIYRGRLRKLPFYAALGNHDYEGNAQAQIDYSKLSERWTMPSRYYSFTRELPGGDELEIFVLDTNPIVNDESEIDAQLVWIEQAITASNACWKIVVGHHPLRSGGRPRSATKAMRQALLPILDRAPIDLYLSGHDHYLEYGATDDGVEYAISGAGGKLHGRVVQHEHARFASYQLGFLAIHASQHRLVLEFIGATGKTIFQKAITKARAPEAQVAQK